MGGMGVLSCGVVNGGQRSRAKGCRSGAGGPAVGPVVGGATESGPKVSCQKGEHVLREDEASRVGGFAT
jgi:hypothetical protein